MRVGMAQAACPAIYGVPHEKPERVKPPGRRPAPG